MATYSLINIVFLLVVAALIALWPIVFPLRRTLLVLGVLLVLTALFDSLIIGFSIVGYDVEKILGIYILKAPIEDFAYAIAAAFLVPFLWETLKERGT